MDPPLRLRIVIPSQTVTSPSITQVPSPIIEPIEPIKPIEPIETIRSSEPVQSSSTQVWLAEGPTNYDAVTPDPAPPANGTMAPNESVSRTNNKLMIYGQRWYYLLVPDASVESPKRSSKTKRARSLMDDYRLSQIDGKLVVVLTTPNEKRIYSLFDSYIEFGHYQQKFPAENRCFYEVIFGEFPQKPHFDIDIDQSDIGTLDLDTLALEIRDAVIRQVILILNEYGITLHLDRDVLVYTSHGPTKRSFHLVINNYCHVDHKEARRLYDRVFDGISKELTYPMLNKWIDPAVYSSKQQFRIVGSQKFKTNRPKKFESVWTYQGQTIQHRYIEPVESPSHEYILQLEESLVSHTSSCNILPSLMDPAQVTDEPTTNPAIYRSEDVSTDLARRALQMCADKAGISIHDRKFPYQIRSINGGIISLKRVKASRCQICNKVHEHENPYIFIIESNGTKNVYFDCRRKPGKKLWIGSIDDPTASVPATEPASPSPIMQTGINWCANVPQRLALIATSPDPSAKPIILPLAEQHEDPKIRQEFFLKGL
jgi:hypothetical protein